MKKLLIFTLAAFVFAGCYNGYSGAKSGSFAQQIAELEKQPVPQAGAVSNQEPLPGAIQPAAADREKQVALEAQKERRAEVAPEESNYIFKIKPDKGTYFFDQDNQVVNAEEPKKDEYTAKRLWSKPKRFKPENYDKSKTEGAKADSKDGAAASSDASASADSSADADASASGADASAASADSSAQDDSSGEGSAMSAAAGDDSDSGEY